MPAAARRLATDAFAAAVSSIRTRWRTRSGAAGDRAAEVGQEIPLVLDRVARAQVGRTRHDLGVHPGSPLDRIADPAGRAGGPGQERRARAAVEIDDQVEAGAAQLAGERQVGGDPPPAAQVRHHLDDVDAGMALDDRRGRRLHQIGDLGLGKGVADGGDGRRREHHVADEPQPHQQDFHRWRAPDWCARPCEHARRMEQFDFMTRGAALMLLSVLGATLGSPPPAGAQSEGGAIRVGHSLLRVHSRPTPRIPRPDPAGARSVSAGRRGRPEERGHSRRDRHPQRARQPHRGRHPRRRPGPGHRPGERRSALRARDDPRRRARGARRSGPAGDRRQAHARRRDLAPRARPPEPSAGRRPGHDARPPLSDQARFRQGARAARPRPRARAGPRRSRLPDRAGAARRPATSKAPPARSTP